VPRPRGRPPSGKDWDAETGEWVDAETGERTQPPAPAAPTLPAPTASGIAVGAPPAPEQPEWEYTLPQLAQLERLPRRAEPWYRRGAALTIGFGHYAGQPFTALLRQASYIKWMMVGDARTRVEFDAALFDDTASTRVEGIPQNRFGHPAASARGRTPPSDR